MPDGDKSEKVDEKESVEKLEGKESEKESKDDVIDIKNVLVIDDSAALRRVLVKYVVNKFYCEVFEADNGKEGLTRIAEKSGNINLILCDLMMPVMDGMTFIRTYKANEKLKDIPVICLTAKNDKETVTQVIKLGACDFIVKPYDLGAVSKKISKYLTPKS